MLLMLAVPHLALELRDRLRRQLRDRDSRRKLFKIDAAPAESGRSSRHILWR